MGSCEDFFCITIFIGVLSSLIPLLFSVGYNPEDKYKFCRLSECCNPNLGWVVQDLGALRTDLETDLVGQPLARKMVLRYLSNHLRKESPKKPLVMSFHGGEGTGKKFTLDMIINRMYFKGTNSCFFKRWIGELDFTEKNKTLEYIRNIKNTIEEKVSSCPRSMFVFHEKNNPLPEIRDAFLPYMGYHESVNGIDFRRAVFVFVSREGEKIIDNLTYRVLVEEKRKRDEIMAKEVKAALQLDGTLDDKGGTVDVFVPFLPLTVSHIELCVRSLLFNNNCQTDTKTVDAILKQFSFRKYPTVANEPVKTSLYAIDGCKSVEDVVNMVIELPCINISPG